MTERQRYVLRAALIYAQANLDDLNEAFFFPDECELDQISVNGDVDDGIDEDEINQLLKEWQG